MLMDHGPFIMELSDDPVNPDPQPVGDCTDPRGLLACLEHGQKIALGVLATVKLAFYAVLLCYTIWQSIRLSLGKI